MPSFLQQLLQVICATSLVACGGGGGSSPASQPVAQSVSTSSTSSTTSTTTPPATVYPYSMPQSSTIKFKQEPDVSILNAVGQLELEHCALSLIQHTIAIDLNNDYNDDLFMSVLCGSPDVEFPGSDVEHDAPLRNTVMTIMSQPDGTYAVDNKTLFGKNDVQLGGEHGGVAGFFTPLQNPSNGLPLISYIVSRDDFQRIYADDFSNVKSYQGVFTPNWDGTYEHVQLGETPIWAQGVLGVPNNEYSWDLLYGTWEADWRNDTVYAYRYADNGWQDVSTEYYNDKVKYDMAQQPYLQALDTFTHTPFGETKQINIDLAVAGSGEGITIYEMLGGYPRVFAEWNLYENVEWYQWGSYDEPGCGRREIVVMNGMPYFGGLGWDHFELWWPTPDSEPMLLAFGASKTSPNGEMYDPNREYTCDDEMVEATFIAMFSFINGRLEMVESPFEVDTVEGGGVLKQTIDLNGDGYMDYFSANGWGHDTFPRAWINNKNGKLIETDTSSLPPMEEYTVCDSNNICLTLDVESTFADINNDGIVDLVQWHTGTVVPDLHPYMYEQGVDPDAFKHQSGYINIWYGYE